MGPMVKWLGIGLWALITLMAVMAVYVVPITSPFAVVPVEKEDCLSIGNLVLRFDVDYVVFPAFFEEDDGRKHYGKSRKKRPLTESCQDKATHVPFSTTFPEFLPAPAGGSSWYTSDDPRFIYVIVKKIFSLGAEREIQVSLQHRLEQKWDDRAEGVPSSFGKEFGGWEVLRFDGRRAGNMRHVLWKVPISASSGFIECDSYTVNRTYSECVYTFYPEGLAVRVEAGFRMSRLKQAEEIKQGAITFIKSLDVGRGQPMPR